MLDTLRGQTLAAGFAGFAASSAAFLILAGTDFDRSFATLAPGATIGAAITLALFWRHAIAPSDYSLPTAFICGLITAVISYVTMWIGAALLSLIPGTGFRAPITGPLTRPVALISIIFYSLLLTFWVTLPLGGGAALLVTLLVARRKERDSAAG